MRVLVLHTRYLQRGGEDQVFESEVPLLRRGGVEVDTLEFSNDDFVQRDGLFRATALIWNRDTARIVDERIRRFSPDVVHCHNLFPAASPSVYTACQRRGVPVVQTLHNFRLLCASGTFTRDGKPCQVCAREPVMWAGVRHACYRNDRIATAGLAVMVAVHRAVGTWSRQVSHYIALTRFMKDRFVEAGFADSRISIKPNFVLHDPGERTTIGERVLFAGRLSAEKGISQLLAAWSLDRTLPPLTVAGDGPLRAEIETAAQTDARIEFVGHLPSEQLSKRLADAHCAVVPSACFEGFPMFVSEAYAHGVPVVAPRHGAFLEVVKDGESGLLFEPGNPASLAATIGHMRESGRVAEWGHRARAEYEALYTPETNFRQLVAIYRQVADSAASHN